MATKAERIRLARRARQALSRYVDLQDKELRKVLAEQHDLSEAQLDDRAYRWLLAARTDIDTLLGLARAMRGAS